MATGNTPRVLGTLAGIDESRLEPGSVLWDRFAVVGDERRDDLTTVVAVTDLERKLGEPDTQHRLDLHFLPAPRGQREEARLTRAFGIKSRAQPEVYAIGRAGERLFAVCEPAIGRPLAKSGDGDEAEPVKLPRRTLLAHGTELAGLLAELHGADVRGVRFRAEMLRIDAGQVSLDRLSYLIHEVERHDDVQRDIAALIELLRGLAEPNAELDLSLPRSAAELHESLSALVGPLSVPDLPPEPPFIGRTRALGELGRGLDQAQIAQPTALIVQGQRGVGKSRLIYEFVARRRAADDSLVLTGAWQEHSADSRGGLLAALERLPDALARLDLDERDDVRRRINRATRHLGAIVTRSAPALGSVLRNIEELPPLELGEDFSRHTAVIADLLRSIGTQKRPLVLVLDNLESIDASSAAVLKILAQPRPAHHTVIIAGMRTGTSYKPDFDHQDIELSPLSAPEIEQLLVEILPGEVAGSEELSKVLFSISGGLPLAAWTNLRAWIDRGRLQRGVEDGVWRSSGRLRVDSTRLEVYDVFGARLTGASESTRELALRIAVLGTDLSADGLAALEQHAGDGSSAAIADLVARGILTRTPSGGVRFPHDSIRELVLESYDEAQRHDAHAWAAELLTKQKAPVAQIVYHRDLALASNASPEQFDRLSRLHVDAGRERLAVYDLERARWHLERALEHSRDPDQRNIAAEGLADICLLIDDVDTAVSLYTAIIATAEPAHAVATAAKSVAFLFSKSANTEARQLATMALEVVAEPIPTTPIGKIATFLGAVFRSWFLKPSDNIPVRDALCRLYSWLTIMSLVNDPAAMLMYTARGHWVSKGLESGAAAMVRAIEASVWAALRRYDTSNKIFAIAQSIAERVNDSWARGWIYHNWAHISLLPSGRYDDGQDMLDDAIAAFRDTGDVSISIVSIMFKCLYGRDREPADTILGWHDEAIATARRNGKFVATASLDALKLLVLARQGRTDLLPQFVKLTAQLEGEDMTAVDRLIARVYLAYAAYESKTLDFATEQIIIAQNELGDLPGVPDYISEVHLVSALVMLDRPTPSAKERKILRQSVRKLRRAARQSPRLQVLVALLDIELALHVGDRAKAQSTAAQVVAEFEQHENVYAARQSHLVLSRMLKGDNVLAAAEHDRVARNLGKRLGLQDRALLSDFSEIEETSDIFELTVDPGLKMNDSQHDIPAAGMLGSVQRAPRRRPTVQSVESQADVLEAWALTSATTRHTVLKDVLSPLRDALGPGADAKLLEIQCSNPALDVPVAPADLQLVLVNLLLTCRDAVDSSAPITLRIDFSDSAAGEPAQLTVRVSAPSPTNRVPVLSGFSTCERLVEGIGGTLSANVDRREVALFAQLLFAEPAATPKSPVAPSAVIVIHPAADMRESVKARLCEFGLAATALGPDEVDATQIPRAAAIFADSDTLDSLSAFEPLLELRLIELVPSGEMPNTGHYLVIPFTLDELQSKL